MADDMAKLLSLDDKGLSKAENAAAKIFRLICLDLNITPNVWDKKMREFLLSPASGVTDNPTKRSSERSNTNRALSKPKIMWRMLRRALAILNPTEIKYELKLSWDKSLIFNEEPPTYIEHVSKGRQDDLCYMFRVLLQRVAGTPSIWDILVNRWLNKQDQRTATNPPDRSTEKGNIHKTIISKNQHTWPVFCKGLSILGVVEAELTLVLTWGRKVTRHTYRFKTSNDLKEVSDDV
jgi:hypothetical protein